MNSATDEVLRKLGWSDDLIRAFTVGKDFPVIDSSVTYSNPEPKCIDTATLVFSEDE